MKKFINTLLPKLKAHKKAIFIVSTFSFVALLAGFFLLMYFEPISKVDIDSQNNTFKVSKFPLYASSLVIKQDEAEVFNESLTKGISQDIFLRKKMVNILMN